MLKLVYTNKKFHVDRMPKEGIYRVHGRLGLRRISYLQRLQHTSHWYVFAQSSTANRYFTLNPSFALKWTIHVHIQNVTIITKHSSSCCPSRVKIGYNKMSVKILPSFPPIFSHILHPPICFWLHVNVIVRSVNSIWQNHYNPNKHFLPVCPLLDL
jgi:hypothetical protein